MRVALFGDIHGNIYALQAVLAALRSQRPDALIVTGDLVCYLPWGAEVVDLLRSLPCHCILGEAELYVALWQTPLWPNHWLMPLANRLVQWEAARLGPSRLAWLAHLPEHVAFSGGRLEDLLAVHGLPGNPFLPFLPDSGAEGLPWVQTNSREKELLAGLDADVLACGHTHVPFVRWVPRSQGHGSTLIVSPGSITLGRGKEAAVGRADYALLDWSGTAGWQATLHSAHYDIDALRRSLLALRGDYPAASYLAGRRQSPGAIRGLGAEEALLREGWGQAPSWWDTREDLPAWRELRGAADG